MQTFHIFVIVNGLYQGVVTYVPGQGFLYHYTADIRSWFQFSYGLLGLRLQVMCVSRQTVTTGIPNSSGPKLTRLLTYACDALSSPIFTMANLIGELRGLLFDAFFHLFTQLLRRRIPAFLSSFQLC